MENLETYLAQDRRIALAQGGTLPDRALGSVLFADISGFTLLTEAYTRSLGIRRGAEELTRQLNLVYDALIAQIEKFGGSVITFSGDATTCFFAKDEGGRMKDENDSSFRLHPSSFAVACAFALQETMRQFSAVRLPDGSTTALALKVAVASGSVRRFVVGDPNIRQLDVIAGSPIARTAIAEHLARPGEILIDEAIANFLGAQIEIAEWREDSAMGERFAVLKQLRAAVSLPPLSPLNSPLRQEILKPWLHAAMYERAQAEGEAFLSELRPVVALFARFLGIDFDGDAAAGEKLDRLISRVQQILARYDGALLELTIGDKGSYFYATFGVPHAHEDDARRAVYAARELFPLCVELGFLQPLQVGISQGVMRVGGYGGTTRRMYGAQGDEVNLAARLMTEAAPGELLISGRIQAAVATDFDLEPLPPIRLKGKAEPLLPFVVQGLRDTRAYDLQEAYYSLPMIGREREAANAHEKLELARRGMGQIVGITAPAGMGKSRLTAEIIRAMRRRGEASYGGECQSFGENISYHVWMPIWRAFFGVDSKLPLRRQIRALENELDELVPERVDALPLLSAVLHLALPENDFTRALEPEFRKSALEALLLDCVRAAAQEARTQGQAILFVVEDAHWIDPASREWLELLAASIAELPILIVLTYRPRKADDAPLQKIETLEHFTKITLNELTDAQAEGLIRAKLAQHAPENTSAIPTELITRITTQAQGNPFYIEQLLDYLHDRGMNLRDVEAFKNIELPNTLHRLVLSRIDQLSERQQLTLKAASIIGRWFSVAHLCGYFPRLGPMAQVEQDLTLLQKFDLTVRDQPELAYLFKHLVTRQVAYEALAYATRALLHEAYAHFLETQSDAAQHLDLIAYHYDRSENLPKRREYLRRAGEAAAARFANVEAVDYLTRALAIAPASDLEERFALLTTREHVFDVQGERERQRTDLAELAQIANDLNDASKQLRVLSQQGWLAERTSNHVAANQTVQQMRDHLATVTLPTETRAELEIEMALLAGVILWQQGNAIAAKPRVERSLELAREGDDRMGQARALNLLGSVYYDLGEYARAQSSFQEQLPLAYALGDRRREWSTLNNLGLIANTRGDFDTALEHYGEALKIAHEIGDRLGEALLLSNLALAAMAQGEYDLAEKYGQQARVVANAIGDRQSVRRIVLNLGETHRLRGDYVTAEQETQLALEMARTLGDRLGENFALMNLAALALDQNELERARTLIAEALPLAREIGHRDGEGFLLNTLGHAQLAAGETDAAQATFENALAIWQILETSVESLSAHAGLAEIALQRNDLQSALAYVKDILTYLDAHDAQKGHPAALGASLVAYRVLEQTKDPRARVVLESAYNAFQARAEKIADETLRRSFLENVRVNRKLREVDLAGKAWRTRL